MRQREKTNKKIMIGFVIGPSSKRSESLPRNYSGYQRSRYVVKMTGKKVNIAAVIE